MARQVEEAEKTAFVAGKQRLGAPEQRSKPRSAEQSSRWNYTWAAVLTLALLRSLRRACRSPDLQFTSGRSARTFGPCSSTGGAGVGARSRTGGYCIRTCKANPGRAAVRTLHNEIARRSMLGNISDRSLPTTTLKGSLASQDEGLGQEVDD
jgi:hypothetical protein